MRGHAAPAADAVVVGAADAALGATLADGRRLARCLRCDTWIEHPPPDPESATWTTLPPLAELTLPRRGAALREAIVMRLISLNKAAHALVFTLLAVMLTLIETNLDEVHDWAGRMVERLDGPIDDTGQGASQGWLSRQLHHLFDLQPGTLRILLALAIAYAVVEWAEAYGLWRERRWAEYLTVIATTGFLPLEVHELIERVTVLRILALAVNVALVVWLVVKKHLFGVRGGVATLLHETTVDWSAVLQAPSPARGRRRATAVATRPPVAGASAPPTTSPP